MSTPCLLTSRRFTSRGTSRQESGLRPASRARRPACQCDSSTALYWSLLPPYWQAMCLLRSTFPEEGPVPACVLPPLPQRVPQGPGASTA